MAKNSQKQLKMVEIGWIWMDLDKNGLKLIEIAKMVKLAKIIKIVKIAQVAKNS